MAKAKKKAKKVAKKVAKKAKVIKKTKPVKSAKTVKKAKPVKKAKVVKKAKPKLAIKNVKPTKVINLSTVVTPLDDRVFVQAEGVSDRTSGGLFIPDTALDQDNLKGKIVVAGRGHMNSKGKIRSMDVKAGDTILFAKFSGTKLILQGEELLVLRESEILGIVD